MPLISSILKKRIERDFLTHPLSAKEFRCIPKMAGYFVSIEPQWEEKNPLFFWAVNDTVLNIYYVPTQETSKKHDQNTKA